MFLSCGLKYLAVLSVQEEYTASILRVNITFTLMKGIKKEV
jgi:hypothetical protein